MSALRCSLLARVSKADQAEDEHKSLDAQLRQMRERATREGWQIVHEYRVPGESAYTANLEKRRIVASAIAAAEAGEFEILVIHESSRIARNALVDRQIRDRLDACGVELVDLANPVSRKNAIGKFMVGFQAQANEYWSDMISEHAKKAYQERFDRGLHCGDAPFGYTYGATTNYPLVIVREEADAVIRAFEDYVRGKGFTEISREWNALGFRPRSKSGRTTFNITGIQRVLGNDYYAGFVRHHGERRKGIHEAIISEELWLEAQSRICRRPKVRGEGGALLTGLVTCAACGGAVWTTSASSGRYQYYRDAARSQGRDCAHAGEIWRTDQADAVVSEIVRALAVGDDWLARVEREARKAPKAEVEVPRKSLLAEKTRITNAYLAGALEESAWRIRLADVDRRLKAAPVRQTAPVRNALDRVRSFAELWDGASVAVRRQACQLLFESVAADMDTHTVHLKPWDEFQPLFELRRAYVGMPKNPAGGDRAMSSLAACMPRRG
jgi:DNA invertase Pin-like site-specific DNA recombinase